MPNTLRKFQYILEGIDQEQLTDILVKRLKSRYPDISTKYEEDVLHDAAMDVASFHAGAEELGTSDIGSMIREVIKNLERFNQRGQGEKMIPNSVRGWRINEETEPERVVRQLKTAKKYLGQDPEPKEPEEKDSKEDTNESYWGGPSPAQLRFNRALERERKKNQPESERAKKELDRIMGPRPVQPKDEPDNSKPVTESSGTTAAGYTWQFEPGREVPMKPDVDANTFIRVKDPTGKTICGVWADVEGDSIQIEYSQVFDEELRGRGVYTDVLRSLSKQYTVISDKDNNNAATSIYKRLGADYDHRGERHTLRKQGVAKAKLEEIGFASALDGSTFSTDSLLKIGKVIGQVENNDVMMASAGSEVVYFLVVNNEITSFIGLNKGYLKNIKNFTKTSGVVRALLGYLIHIEGKKIKISADEPLTADGIKWITYLIKSPRGLQIIDTFGKPVDPIALKKEWELSKKSGNSGPTGIVISENQIFGNKLRDNEERRKQRSLLMPFNMYEMPNCSNQGVTEDEHATQPRPRVVDSMKSMVNVGSIQLNVAIDGAEVSIRPIVDGYQAGYVVFDRDGSTLVPDDLAIDDEFRGRGIAKIIYDYVKSLGFTIRRSSDQTRAGKHFWDKNRGKDSQVWEQTMTAKELDEACWKGYHKEGMKTMFGKRYPNCVKNTNEEQDMEEDKKPSFMKSGNMKPFTVTGKEKPKAVNTLEKLLMKAKERGITLNYHNIDQMMQAVCKKHNLTGDDLHNHFVDKHHMIPDKWIKKQDVSEAMFTKESACPHCGGELVSEEMINEKKDACYYKVKSRYKVWPSAYASGALVQCRKKGASNWGTKSESSILEGIEQTDENLHKWFKEKWVRFGPDGKIRGDCARGDDSEGKPKCLPQSKAQNLGKKGRASAAARKRREDPNPERSGQAINVATKKKTSESSILQGISETKGLPMPGSYEQENKPFLRKGGQKLMALTTEQEELDEKWSDKYKRSIDCSHPKGFSQRAHCQGKKKK